MSTDQREPWADPFAGLPLLISVPRAAKLIGISRAAAHQTPWPPHLRRHGQAA